MTFIETVTDFISTYWWVLIPIVAIIFYFLIWKKLDIYTKIQFKKFFSKRNLIIIGFAVGWFVWNKFGGEIITKKANFWMPLLLLIIMGATYYFEKLRYDSQQVICANGVHGSFNKAPIKVGGFLIFALDTFNAGGLSWDYARRILVARVETIEFGDRGAFCIARPYPVDITQLHPRVEIEIKKNKHLKGATEREIYYGWFDDPRIAGKSADWSKDVLKKLEKIKEQSGIFNLIKETFGVKNPTPEALVNLIEDLSVQVNIKGETLETVTKDKTTGAEYHRTQEEIYGKRPVAKVEPYEEGVG